MTPLLNLHVVSCPDLTQPTRGEGVWCHKHKAANEIAECHLLECRSENKYFNCTPQSDVMESLFTLTNLLIYTNSTRTRLQYFCKFKDSPARHREGLLCPIHEPTQWRPGEIHLMMNKTDRSNYISLLAVFVHSISYSCSCSGFLKLSGL